MYEFHDHKNLLELENTELLEKGNFNLFLLFQEMSKCVCMHIHLVKIQI